MKQNTNTLPNFQIYENGELQTPSVLERVSTVAGNAAMSALSATYEASKRLLGECATSFQLDMHDQAYGTTMRREYFARKQELAETALRQEIGL